MATRQQPPDMRVPPPERKAKLEAAYEQQKNSDAPYKGAEILTLGELQWIMQQRHWSGVIGSEMQRANLSGAKLEWTNLGGTILQYANLSGASLRGTNLGGAILSGANLSRANLTNANLSGARLRHADLRGANLWVANLSGASLFGANLCGACLDGANLCGADLTNSLLIDTTFLLFDGTPQWPPLSAAEQTALREEATNPTTPVERLAELAWCWPGVLIPDPIAANPNTPADTLKDLALRAPASFLRNPILSLLFLEHPHWLSDYSAQVILQAITDQQVSLSPADTAIVHLIEHCANPGQ